MAENPAQWGPATKVIDEVLRQIDKDMAAEAASGEIRAGNTRAMQIARALHAKGHITRDEMWKDRD
jgi:hypothetical protein